MEHGGGVRVRKRPQRWARQALLFMAFQRPRRQPARQRNAFHKLEREVALAAHLARFKKARDTGMPQARQRMSLALKVGFLRPPDRCVQNFYRDRAFERAHATPSPASGSRQRVVASMDYLA